MSSIQPCGDRLAGAEEQKSFFLPKSPTAAAYVLGRLSNQELAQAPRSEFVYVALLQRNGMERKYRAEALEGLARLRSTSPLMELLKAISELDRKGLSAEPTLRDLGSMLLQTAPAEMKGQRSALEKLAAESQTPFCRQLGYAGLVTADGSMDAVWREAEGAPSKQADVLLSVVLLRDATLRTGSYGKIEPQLRRADSAEVRHAAITAIVFVPDHDAETFKTLATLVSSQSDRDVAIASLGRLPRSSWPRDQVQPLVGSLLAYLQGLPAAQRTSPEGTRAFQLATDLTGLMPADQAAAANRVLRSLGVAVFVVRTLRDQMLYDKTRIVVEAGKQAEIVLLNEDAMPHNLAVLAPGKLQEIGEAAEKMQPTPDNEGRLYIPQSPAVLHATRLVEPGQQARLSFSAPDLPGDYPYVCTFPGHWRRMSGMLVVVKDLEAYLADHPEPAPTKVTEWKLEDLAPDLTGLDALRNPAAGRELFTQLACRQCHKIAGEGLAYGPDLTEVFQRWRGDATNVLQQILEPSKVIDERYRVFNFELKDGDEVAGMILKDDSDSLTLRTGPGETQVQTLKKSQIVTRKAQTSSVMPIGLLNTLSKEQVLDLLAYLRSGGNVASHEHSH